MTIKTRGRFVAPSASPSSFPPRFVWEHGNGTSRRVRVLRRTSFLLFLRLKLFLNALLPLPPPPLLIIYNRTDELGSSSCLIFLFDESCGVYLVLRPHHVARLYDVVETPPIGVRPHYVAPRFDGGRDATSIPLFFNSMGDLPPTMSHHLELHLHYTGDK